MDVYSYIFNKETTISDFLDTVAKVIRNTDINPHKPFSQIGNGVVISTYGLNRYALESILHTIREDRDHGIELLMLDLITDMHGNGDNNVSQDEVRIDQKYLLPLKEYSVFGLYKKLRKFTTRYIASRATLLVLIQYVRALNRRNS